YGLQTDASQRFERGVDPALQARAAERATRLLMGIAGGKPGPLVDVRADRHLPTPVAITLRAHRISRLLGMDIEPVQVVDILQRLGMNVTAIAGGWRVTPPSFRFDISLEADLIEEIARIHGYDRVPDHQPSAQLPMPRCAEGIISRARMRDTLVQRGYQEAITFSFVDPDLQRRFDPTPAIALVNPIAADLAVLRTSLWPGLVKALLHNQKRQQERVRLFEVGRVFRGDVEALQQDHMIGAIASRDALPRQWGAAKRSVDFFDVKGDLEALLALTGEPEAFTFAAASHPALHPGQTARILRNDIPVGWLGALHPALGLALEIEDKAFVFELAVAELNPALVPQFRELSRFPASRRDLAVVVDEAVSAEQLRKCIAHSGGKQLRDVTIFDYYRGLGVPAGQKSLAFSLIFQDFTSNLTDSAVEDAMALIRAELHEQFGATPRA
ncbi:MAG: phenylalanine--tRNA ligase subunit beta, partial [Gammaproteobacteria bacterium]